MKFGEDELETALNSALVSFCNKTKDYRHHEYALHNSILFKNIFRSHNITITEVRSHLPVLNMPDYNNVFPMEHRFMFEPDYMTPVYVFLVGLFSSYFAYIFGN